MALGLAADHGQGHAAIVHTPSGEVGVGQEAPLATSLHAPHYGLPGQEAEADVGSPKTPRGGSGLSSASSFSSPRDHVLSHGDSGFRMCPGGGHQAMFLIWDLYPALPRPYFLEKMLLIVLGIRFR